ncbi:MAG: ATP-dependent Clp protease proteolytic subunit [Bacilli bacterium]|nr:ATP-dependent Clp protease proteolytic subunit [Bacilli bacterium]
MFIPTIQESTSNGEKVYDIYSKLLDNRIIFINGEINDSLSNLVISELLYLDSINHNDIDIYINSPGGSVTSGLAIVDTMDFIKSDVRTTVTGIAASMASIILANGTKGKRYSLKNSEVMIHQPLGNTSGQATDIEIHAKRIINKKKLLNKLLATLTNQSIKKIEKDTERDKYLTSLEALEYGLIDSII